MTRTSRRRLDAAAGREGVVRNGSKRGVWVVVRLVHGGYAMRGFMKTDVKRGEKLEDV